MAFRALRYLYPGNTFWIFGVLFEIWALTSFLCPLRRPRLTFALRYMLVKRFIFLFNFRLHVPMCRHALPIDVARNTTPVFVARKLGTYTTYGLFKLLHRRTYRWFFPRLARWWFVVLHTLDAIALSWYDLSYLATGTGTSVAQLTAFGTNPGSI